MVHTSKHIWAFSRSDAARFLVLACAAAVTGGCSILRKDLGHPLPEASLFQDGKTHYRDVLAVAGPPLKLSATEGGLVFLYEHTALEELQFGISFDYPLIRLLKFTVGQSKADREVLVLVFDDQGILRSHRSRAWEVDLGRGMAVQLIVAVVPVTDTGSVDDDPQINEWCTAMLRARVPEALNRQSSLETGQQGVEMTGTPHGAGQHTLEIRPYVRIQNRR